MTDSIHPRVKMYFIDYYYNNFQEHLRKAMAHVANFINNVTDTKLISYITINFKYISRKSIAHQANFISNGTDSSNVQGKMYFCSKFLILTPLNTRQCPGYN